MQRLWRYADVTSAALILVGAALAIATGIPGVIVMLTGLAVSLGVHLGVGTIAYRRVMAREWPKTEPTAEDDDW